MVNNISKILTQVFHRDSLEDVSETELRYFIRQHPYFGPGHLLLAKKLQLAGEKRAFDREVAVTSAYFTNPAWLQYILRETEPGDAIEQPGEGIPERETQHVHPAELDKAAAIAADVADAPLVHPADLEKAAAVARDVPALEEDASAEKEKYAEKGLEHSSDLTQQEVKEIIAADADPVEDASAGDTIDATATTDRVQATQKNANVESFGDTVRNDAVDINDTVDGFETIEASKPATAQEESKPQEEETETHSHQFVVESGEADASDTNDAAAIEADAEPVAEVSIPADREEPSQPETVSTAEATAVTGTEDTQPQAVTPVENSVPSRQVPEETVLENDSKSPELPTDKISRALQEEPSATPDTSESLAFDPYHTIDYFASQGIKLRLEDFNKDKLGQQLKSFTEWIRSMKRLPAQTPDNNMGETEQHSIRKIAEHSIEGKDVLTESMAEVWVKQGNYEKARQIYQKLSLQNPSKSTYFAAKIDQLNAL